MSMRAFIVLLWILSACRTEATPPSAPASTAHPEILPAATGVIHGRIRLDGAPPPLRSLPLQQDPRGGLASAPDDGLRLHADGSLRDAVVRIVGDVPGDYPPPRGPVVFRQVGCV
jgi:hypothetical protein